MYPLTIALADLSSAATIFINPGITCRVVKAHTVVKTALTTGDSIITIRDKGATNNVGTVTITQAGNAVGDCDKLVLDTTTLGVVEFDADNPIEIYNDATPDAGAAELTIWIDEFHGAV